MSYLGEYVLTLDKNYRPVSVITARNAMCLLCKDAAVALDDHYNTYSFDDWTVYGEMVEDDDSRHFIEGARKKFLVPDIILLRSFALKEARHMHVRYSRKKLFIRDGYTCLYCGDKLTVSKLTMDHIVPRSQGGRKTWGNSATACGPCNSKKDNRTPEEANMPLLKEAATPENDPVLFFWFVPESKRKKWKDFIKV